MKNLIKLPWKGKLKKFKKRYLHDNVEKFSGKITVMRRFIYNTSNPSYYIQTSDQKVYFEELN
jgi:hypothetical protein